MEGTANSFPSQMARPAFSGSRPRAGPEGAPGVADEIEDGGASDMSFGLIEGCAELSAPNTGAERWPCGSGAAAKDKALSKKRGNARRSGSAAKGEPGETGCATCRNAGGAACDSGAGGTEGESAPPTKVRARRRGSQSEARRLRRTAAALAHQRARGRGGRLGWRAQRRGRPRRRGGSRQHDSARARRLPRERFEKSVAHCAMTPTSGASRPSGSAARFGRRQRRRARLRRIHDSGRSRPLRARPAVMVSTADEQ